MLSVLALAVALAQDPPEGKVTTGRDRSSALQLQFSGHFDLHYVSRDGALNEAGRVLNGLLRAEQPTTNAWAGRFSLRADVTVKDAVTGVLELENRSFDSGLNRPFSSGADLPTILIRQGYIDAPDFLVRGLDLRIGIQDLRYRNRPHDECFFMDLGESESFFGGLTATGSQIRNSVDRDVEQATGVKFGYAPNDFMGFHGAALVYGEGGATSSDESVYLLGANSLLGEHWAAWLLAVLVSGGDPDLREIVTVGAGVNGYLGETRALELFVEVYGQSGTLMDSPLTVRKEAYAFNVGARYLGIVWDRLWIEGAFSERTGNRRSGDRKDQAFQSYENENRFLILQSAEFGLDVDTNVRLLRAAVGIGPIPLAEGRPLRVQLDVGRFSAMTDLVDLAGTRFAGSKRQWGLETDLTSAWSYNESLSFKIQAAGLWGSDLLESLTEHGRDRAFLIVAGADLKF
jgi:hypothetical protein